jgi:hypothetical protein
MTQPHPNMKSDKLNEELPQFLQDMKARGDGLEVPEGYFDAMEDAVFARLRASGDLDRPKMQVVKRPGLFAAYIRPRTAMALAAALALVLAAVWFVRQSDSVAQESPLASLELTEEDIESYVLDNLHEFDTEQLASLSKEENLEPIEEATPTTPKQNSSNPEEIHPDDLDQILDEMTDEELEQIL